MRKKFKKTTVSPKVAANRRNGQKGGLVTASRYSTEQRQAWGKSAGQETLKRYGRNYFSYIVKLRWKRHKKKRKKESKS